MFFNETTLEDAMAIGWRLLEESPAIDSKALPQVESFAKLWRDYTAEFGGCGMLDPPLDEWIYDNARAREFIDCLDNATSAFEHFGTSVPLEVVRMAVIEPRVYESAPPVSPYVDVIAQLKSLIVQGLGDQA